MPDESRTTPPQAYDSRSHVRDIARAADNVARLEDEMDILKATLKLAKEELSQAIDRARFYAHDQLSFEFRAPA